MRFIKYPWEYAYIRLGTADLQDNSTTRMLTKESVETQCARTCSLGRERPKKESSPVFNGMVNYIYESKMACFQCIIFVMDKLRPNFGCCKGACEMKRNCIRMWGTVYNHPLLFISSFTLMNLFHYCHNVLFHS